MKHARFLLPLTAVLLPWAACRAPERLAYPAAPRLDVADEYHGTRVPDPYRPLEDADSDATQHWVEAQNELTFAYLEEIPQRERTRARLEQLWDYERTELPATEGGRIFFRRNSGLQNQALLYVVDSELDEPRVLLDPNQLSADGTIALANFVPSPEGDLLLYALSDGGSDWRTWRVRDVETGRDRPDVVTRNKFGGADWAADASGFFYSRFDRPTEGTELQAKNAPPDVCFHRLGTDESADAIVARRPFDEGRTQYFSLSEDRATLHLMRLDIASDRNELHALPLVAGETGWTARDAGFPLVQGFDARFYVLGDDGRTAWIQTDLGAPRGRIVAVDLADPARERWREVVPACDEAIQSADLVGDRLIVGYLKDARALVRVFDLGGARLGEVDLPGIGSVAGFQGDAEDRETFYSFESFTRPASIYRFDLASGKSELFSASPLAFDPAAYETVQVFVPSKDGTRVPVFLTHKKGLARDGGIPTYLYGYGGFSVSITPSFSVPNLVWIERGGLLAVANLRGGGEYGEEWHESGTKLAKQNVFDDFIACAEWLIANDYTRPARLAIAGGSNGGLLVGACMTQRPELFGAALPAVGVLDMLRYHKFTIGWSWAGDYGTADDPAEFRALYAYSPLHNVRPGTVYPATLVTTADHDDRVVPAHSYKFTAALQAAQGGSEPILIRVDTRAGHGAGKPTSMRIDEAADRLSFLERELEIE